MKKITLFIAALVVAMSASAAITVETTWQFGAVNPSTAIESFENCPTAGLPLNWTRFVENVTKGTITNADAWSGTNTERSITGTTSAKMANYASTSDCWLVTPKISITAASATAVSFNWSNTPGDYGSSLEVWISESATQPTASTAFAATAFKTIAEGADNAWHLENLDLTTYIGKSIYLGFKVHNFGDPADLNAGGDNWWLEDIRLPLPNMIGIGNNARGMAFGTINTTPVLALVSREGGTSVRIINTVDGTQTASLNVTGISGGAIAVNDAGITTDGKILVSNVVNASTNIFKIYRWDNYKDAPTVALSYTLPDASRYGDYFTVTGSIAAGTAKIYAASSAMVTSIAKILCWSMIADVANPGSFIFDAANPTVLSSAINWTGACPSVAPLANGTFLYKGNSNSMRIINADGTLSANASSNGTVATGGSSVQFIKTTADSTYVVYFRFGAGQEKADVIKIVAGDLANATVVATTPALGTATNTNGTGRVVVDAVGTGTGKDAYVYVLSTNNGVGKYKITWPDYITSVKETENNGISISALQGAISVSGISASTLELYNTLGQKVKSVCNSNEISTANLQGVYIIQVKANGKVVKNAKISVR